MNSVLVLPSKKANLENIRNLNIQEKDTLVACVVIKQQQSMAFSATRNRFMKELNTIVSIVISKHQLNRLLRGTYNRFIKELSIFAGSVSTLLRLILDCICMKKSSPTTTKIPLQKMSTSFSIIK